MTVPPSPHTIHFKQTHKEIFINTKCSVVIVLVEGLNGGLPDCDLTFFFFLFQNGVINFWAGSLMFILVVHPVTN